MSLSSGNGEEDTWLGVQCDSSEFCPRAGYWKQLETGECIWHELGDKFSGIGFGVSYKSANYVYVGKKKG